MRSIQAIGLAMITCGLLASAYQSFGADPPATRPDMSDPDVVKWWAHCDTADGRRFLTDGGLFLESRYLPNVPVPEKTLPPQAPERLLQSTTDHEFALADLDRKGRQYEAPGSIRLNHKYIDLLRESPVKANWRFRAKGPNDPVLIVDGDKVVGVMMPMKS